MDGGIRRARTRAPRRRSTSQEYYRHRERRAAGLGRSSSSSHGGHYHEYGQRRRRSHSPNSDNHESSYGCRPIKRRRRSPPSGNAANQHRYHHQQHFEGPEFERPRSRRDDRGGQRNRYRENSLSPSSRRGDSRKEQRGKPRRHRRRRRQRRSPSSPPSSPRQQVDRQATGVVSEEDEVLVGPNDRAALEDKNNPNKQGRARSASSHDDTKGHFKGGEGTVIADRYRILRDVGLGTFGRVVEAVDLKRLRRSTSSSRRARDNDGPRVAIKIVRNVKRYCDSAKIEADIVEHVNRRGVRGTALCAMMFDAFTWKSHYCLVFESLGPSLYDFMKRHDYQPFPMVCVRDFARQILEALEFLHSFGLIHTDLKPENILLCSNSSREVSYTYRGRSFNLPESTRIKLIDFGGATYDNDKKKSSIINTRQYRAPEVILGLEWSTPSDLWSAGCILVELYMGELLFATHDNVEHLALMEKCIGPFPRRMLSGAKKTSPLAVEAFDSSGRHRLGRVLPSESTSYVRKAVSIESKIRSEDRLFLQMLRRILVIDPNDRVPAHECVRYRL